jgi:membrane complex biogenesis BtpA family protein
VHVGQTEDRALSGRNGRIDPLGTLGGPNMIASRSIPGQAFSRVFARPKPLIGMIHLPPLPGYPDHPGMSTLVRKALTDLATLEGAGFDGVLVENDNDQPHQIGVSLAIRDAFAEAMCAVIAAAHVPVGMEIIYDMPATVKVAHDVGARFVRLDVFVDSVETRWGIVPAAAGATAALRRDLGAQDLLFLTDVHVKHARLLAEKTLRQSVVESVASGADGLIITGDWTGEPPTAEDCLAASEVATGVPIVIGSGLSADNAADLLRHADAAIVGTSIKSGKSVDPTKAATLVSIVEHLRTAR